MAWDKYFYLLIHFFLIVKIFVYTHCFCYLNVENVKQKNSSAANGYLVGILITIVDVTDIFAIM